MRLAASAPAAPSASAAPVASGGVIHACMLTKGKKATRGLLRVVRSAKTCNKRKGEKPLEWSVAGPAGQAGSQSGGDPGPQGSAGPAGAQGPQGETGAAGTPGSTSALEKSFTETIAKQAAQIQALTAEVAALTSEVATVKTTVGETCTGLEEVTDQTNALRTTLVGVNTALALVKALVSALSVPGLPGALEPFECK